MDEPGVDPAELAGAFRHVAAVNRWLGARRALVRRLPEALEPRERRTFRIVDIGTGSADLPLAVARWADSRGRSVSIAALDAHAGAARAARARVDSHPGIHVLRGDGRRLPFQTGAFDLALLSMTLHHMEGGDREGLLREAARVARGGRVLVGELERAVPNYLGARLLAATLWRSNPVTRHDGPISVLRSFTPDELKALAHRAGLRRPRVYRHVFYRLVLLADAP